MAYLNWPASRLKIFFRILIKHFEWLQYNNIKRKNATSTEIRSFCYSLWYFYTLWWRGSVHWFINKKNSVNINKLEKSNQPENVFSRPWNRIIFNKNRTAQATTQLCYVDVTVKKQQNQKKENIFLPADRCQSQYCQCCAMTVQW